MAKEMMDEIRQAENQAAQTLRAAREKAADIEKAAENQARETVRKEREKALETVRLAREEAEAQGEAEARESALEGAKDVEALKALAAQKEQEAVALVTKLVTETAG